MKLFTAYIKQRRRGIILFAVFCAVFAAAFLLYRLPVEAVLYPAALCVLAAAVLVIVDFTRVRRRHARLAEISRLTAAEITSYPEADGIEEADYQAIAETLRAEAQELAAASDRRFRGMAEYYTMWAHQIKTPIASMRLTLQGEDTPAARRLLSDLFRIEQYVGMVMAFLRLDSDSTDYVFREYDIDGIIKQSVKKFASEFIDRKIRLEYSPISRKIITDEKWFAFVVEQVLSNALKYTREGSIKIFMPSPDTLCIEDTGIGIAPEDLPRIFEKGYTGANGRADKSASGIGLYLCKRVCKNLGIDISAASALGEGTRILIGTQQHKTVCE